MKFVKIDHLVRIGSQLSQMSSFIIICTYKRGERLVFNHHNKAKSVGATRLPAIHARNGVSKRLLAEPKSIN